MKKSPCEKECPNRRPGCHPTCKEYFVWSQIHKAELSQIRERKKGEAVGLLSDRTVKTTTKWHKNLKK